MNYSESYDDPARIKVEQPDGEETQPVATASPENTGNVHEAGAEEPSGQPQPQSSSLRQRSWLLILGATILIIGTGFGWRWWQASNAQGESPAGGGQPPGVPVKIATVQSGTIAETSDYVSSVQSRKSVTLQPQIDGQVTRIFVQAGEQVKAGTPIIQVNPAQQKAAVNSSVAVAESNRAAVENERATLRSLQAERLSNLSNLKYNQEQYNRYTRLYAEGAVTRQQLDENTDKLRAAEATLAQTDAKIKAQQATIERAQKTLEQSLANVKEQQVQLQYYRITAPFTGTVGNIPVKVGDYVTTSMNLANLTQNQSLEVNISIPIERAPDLRMGMPVELINAQGKTVGTSRVFFISPNVSNDTQSVLIKSRFDNSANRLRADQFVRARVVWDRRPGVLVPATAVSRVAGQDFVFIAETKQPSQLVARQKPVKLGDIQGNNYQVLQGLKPGEKIVTSGIQKLSDGAPIAPES